MSGYIRRGECFEAVAKVNSVLTRFEERIRQIRRDMEKLEAENKALKDKVQKLASWSELVGGVVDKHTDRIQTLEIKNEGLSARTSGWQEGFGESVREQFRRIDERFVKLLASDDSADIEIRQWIEDLKALKKDVSALGNRMAGVEQIKPSIVPKPETPLRFTCHTKEELCD